MIPKLKYTIELSMLLMYLIECQVFSGQNFNPVSKQNLNIEFLLKNSQQNYALVLQQLYIFVKSGDILLKR